jgi:hypothetical protein
VENCKCIDFRQGVGIGVHCGNNNVVCEQQASHWLLVTLLICNACALETLPIYLDRIVPSKYAILISVVAVVLVGEVIP